MSDRQLLNGVHALARLLVDQSEADRARGWRTAGLVSGYRGSPLAGLDQLLLKQSKLLAEHDIKFVPGVNEELAATVVYGSQLSTQLPDPSFDGVFGLWYGKAPGVDRSSDAFKHANWMGTTRRGGVLVVAGDDPASKSSTLPSNSAMALAESFMPVLAPASVADVLRLGRLGIEMSRYSGSWVGLTVLTSIADATEVVDTSEQLEITVPEFSWLGRPWQPTHKPGVDIPAALAMEREVLDGRLAAATAFARANGINRIEGARDGARIGFIGVGRSYVELREALHRLGIDDQIHRIRLLRLGMVHPLDQETVREFAEGLDEIVVVEDKRAFVEPMVRDALYDLSTRPRVRGKDLIPVTGELDADRIALALTKTLVERFGVDAVHPLPRRRPQLTLTAVSRTPFFCSGCPHNRSTVVPDGSLAGAGIGCHAMTTFMDRSLGMTQMGGEGATWVGAAPFSGAGHMFQNLGDGTFFHSGSLAVRQAVAAGTNITFKLLYNSAVAMTGGQDADGGIDPVGVTHLLHAEGVAKIVVVADDPGKYPRGTAWASGVTVRHRDDLDAVQRELRTVTGTTVLLYDQACAAETRRKRKRGKAPEPAQRVFINEAVCEGCGDCGAKSNCLSVEPVETEFGRKTRIDQTSCNKDFSCLLGDCPSFMTVVPGKAKAKVTPPQLAGDLPEPAQKPGQANVVLVGVGGTGVVTANQVLAGAALLDGLDARAMDQTGLSQKAGAVVSHLRIGPEHRERPGLVGLGAADTYLAFDALAATAPSNLDRCAPDRTVAVVSTSQTPTGETVTDPSKVLPASTTLLGTIADRTIGGRMVAVDALGVAARLFGSTTAANFLVIGAAYQSGLLPMSAASIEAAIEQNGVGVASTIQAFQAGRKLVLEPGWATQAESTEDGLLRAEPFMAQAKEILAAAGIDSATALTRTADLIGYQDSRYARRYVDVLAGVENAAVREVVARQLYKLMAYKDEYEVARLHLDPAVRQQFGPDAKVKVMLHPPLLRAMGMRRKLALGRTAGPAFRVLRSMRRLRGGRLDLFGYAAVRRLERDLITEYVAVVGRLAGAPEELALRIADLPDMVRGYEDIKVESVRKYRAELANLVAELGKRPQPVR
ncbi:indolepyruvate ferredoxin oxidoreductase family protein [Kutzneria sp. CA-103260]|uniref:indolepyruvate ferredoxin oxidoreductase family protein n=1 Tax=Kutzneria sp. CA-103260 TaxID=2802641 RepID=UPI001BA6490C|nr:indolepyruvate ferredoxin oxidoreductase family protein [Kutzneria sp. CA-103260]QUQ63196.1 indolepyruvate ferredoxin oxidoreductase [Kutzneria sp. CA-103260]